MADFQIINLILKVKLFVWLRILCQENKMRSVILPELLGMTKTQGYFIIVNISRKYYTSSKSFLYQEFNMIKGKMTFSLEYCIL